MRIPSGVTDQFIYFVAVDSTDFTTRETGLTSFTVFRSRDGAAAVAMTTPTINETDSTNMPGVYELLLDEDMTIGSGNDSEEMAFHITQASMSPVTRTIELYRSKITAGNTLGVASDGDISGNLDGTVATVSTLTGHTVQTGDNFVRLGSPAGASVSADIADLPTVSEFNARTLVSANYFDFTTDAVDLSATAVDDIWDEPLSGHNTGGTTGKSLKNAASIVLRDGTLQAGSTASTAILDSGASALDDFFNHARIVLTSGTGAGQERIISDYVGSTKTATITPDWITTPDATSLFEVLFGSAHAETVGGGYEGGQVWIDTVIGTAGTGLYVNGTIDNPVDNISDARTIADLLGLRMFHMLPGSSITLAQSFDNFEFGGAGFQVALGGQSVSGTRFFNSVNITGTATGTDRVFFQDCVINGATLPIFFARGCRIVGTMVLADADDYFFDLCFGGASGSSLAIIDFGAAVLNTTVHMTHSANGFEFQNMGQAGTDILIMDGLGQVTFNANCIGGTATFIGVFNLINNGSVTITEADIINTATEILTDTADMQPKLGTPAADISADIADLPTVSEFNARTLTAADIAKLSASVGTIVSAVAQTGTLSSTQMTSDLSEATDDHFIGRIILWTSGALTNQATDITDYAGTGGLLTFTLVTDVPVNGDTFIIV